MTRRLAAVIACALLAAGCKATPDIPAESRARLAAPPPAPFLMFVDTSSSDAFKHVLTAPLPDPARSAFVTPLVCERVYFAGGRGFCLADAKQEDLPVRRWGVAFDSRFEVIHRFPLYGVPSRIRVSPDGHWAATTLFENGHSYAEAGFSTMTRVFDLETKTVAIDDLEDLVVTRDNTPFNAVDFNFWGVTFAQDSDTFYATLATGGRNYLIKGSVRAKTAAVIHEGVECPSISPDNGRIAFKKRIGGSKGWWQIAILDLKTMKESLLATETRSVDDQVEWLDTGRVMYHLSSGSTGADIWVAPVDGSSKPQILVPSAYSPAVVAAR